MGSKDKYILELEKITKIQTSNGNWDYDPYMQGLANGLIMALSMARGKEPKFLEAPEVWLSSLNPALPPTEAINETKS